MSIIAIDFYRDREYDGYAKIFGNYIFLLLIGGVFTNEENQSSAFPLLATLPLIYKLVVADFDKRNFAFSRMQFYILVALYQYEPLTMTEIAEFASTSKEQVTRAVAPLVDAGFAERRVEPENRRSVHIYLTDAGRKSLHEHWQRFNEHITQLYDKYLTTEEREELTQSLHSVIRILRKMK